MFYLDLVAVDAGTLIESIGSLIGAFRRMGGSISFGARGLGRDPQISRTFHLRLLVSLEIRSCAKNSKQ